jgi:predicted Zn-dependent protease
MRSVRALLVLAAGLSLTACESAPVTGRSQMILVSESQELQLGLQTYRQILATEQQSRNPQLTALVEKVGRRIASAAERPQENLWRRPAYQWEFKTIEKDEINAFCLPGGKVLVYSGLLPIARDETGLAVIMGHEVAHALAHHGAERLSNQLAATAGLAAAAAILSSSSNSNDRANLPLMMAALGAGATVGYLLPMSRAQEAEADHIGLILMAQAGYDPRQAPALWERMRTANRGARMPEWLSTHPTDDARIADIRSWVPEAMKYYRPKD